MYRKDFKYVSRKKCICQRLLNICIYNMENNPMVPYHFKYIPVQSVKKCELIFLSTWHTWYKTLFLRLIIDKVQRLNVSLLGFKQKYVQHKTFYKVNILMLTQREWIRLCKARRLDCAFWLICKSNSNFPLSAFVPGHQFYIISEQGDLRTIVISSRNQLNRGAMIFT